MEAQPRNEAAIKVKLLNRKARIPARADSESAGFDLSTPEDFTVMPGRNVVPLGFAIELKPGTDAHIRPRSGFSAKGMEGWEMPGEGSPRRYDADVLHGTIDSGYRGEVCVIVKSWEGKPFTLAAGTRFAQMVIEKIDSRPLEQADELSDTERGAGGFGHTGTR